jgi:hypothetical protein
LLISNSNLYRYAALRAAQEHHPHRWGLYKLNPVVTHELENAWFAPGFNPCAYEVKNWFQAFAFKWVSLYRCA